MALLTESMEFLLSIKPTKSCRVADLNYFEVENEKEFKDRQSFLNFNFGSCINLKLNEKEFNPSLCHWVRNNGLGNRYDFSIIFTPNIKQEISDFKIVDSVEFVFDDCVFGTGITTFSIDIRDIKDVPKLKY
ncbi:hypothetical protein [Saccharicrinis aurantiacus]|uniref:hypothetical protein n=1 Tax=Saccharicrinis aurantiacus TaxID=1849719 RepID=UPI0011152198|nr:hypothetical protein [Saccharicrinis aurantiacus]